MGFLWSVVFGVIRGSKLQVEEVECPHELLELAQGHTVQSNRVLCIAQLPGRRARVFHPFKGAMPGSPTLLLCRKQRRQMHNHLRQNMCPAHQNRSLANGPSHPRLDPEEIQMADVSGVPRPALLLSLAGQLPSLAAGMGQGGCHSSYEESVLCARHHLTGDLALLCSFP